MCNGYPSLRCSRHAKNLLTAAEQKLNDAVTWEDKEEANRVHERALKVFYTTPAGFKELEDKIASTTDELKKDKLYSLLLDGQRIRREAKMESLRIKRVNKEKIDRASLMRKTGLPWWVVACQFNVEFIEKEHNTKLVNNVGVNDNETNVDTYSIDLKTQSFFITVHDEDGVETKYLSISNHHSQIIYDETKTFTSTKNILALTDYYKSRGENKPIEFSELLSKQKTTVLGAVKESFKRLEIDKIIVSDPKIGFSRIVELDDLQKYFDFTLYTPLSLHNGTDPLTDNYFEKFNAVYNNSLFVSEPQKVDKRYLVEAVDVLSKEQRNFDGFTLVPLKDNVYEIKKSGHVRGRTVRCVLKLTGE